jgi:pyruvate kinase
MALRRHDLRPFHMRLAKLGLFSLTAMSAPCLGVMIARGDLAVECGFERMAEVQEEILWFCEAAQVPVILATQVLETLAQKGVPSRAEITDAAMGRRDECVMLNKGPYVLSSLRVLDNILQRMQAHHAKNRSMLRELHLAHLLIQFWNVGLYVVCYNPGSRNLQRCN